MFNALPKKSANKSLHSQMPAQSGTLNLNPILSIEKLQNFGERELVFSISCHIMSAKGGVIVSLKNYDLDRSTNYVISDLEDIPQRLGEIIYSELKREI